METASKRWHRHSCLCALGSSEPSVLRLIQRGAHRQECLCHLGLRHTTARPRDYVTNE